MQQSVALPATHTSLVIQCAINHETKLKAKHLCLIKHGAINMYAVWRFNSMHFSLSIRCA
jgi:hypothetical protein